MTHCWKFKLAFWLALALWPAKASWPQVCNIKVVTDASPDYYDMDSMICSITAKWETPKEKCWALFYWNHIARRQTSPMNLHGLDVTDPIRQFNDYGYTMCSTIAGINCSIWDAMGLRARYWDISHHTVSEVEYDGRWHMCDNSMSAIYTLCDGKTTAGVEDIDKEGGCEASGGKVEPGHIAKYHCLNSTGKRSFLTGAGCARSLDQMYRCFNPNGLKYRYYYYDWDRGHRYILNLRDGEVYTRYYKSLGDSADFYVPNRGKDPEKVNERYRIRGNGIRTFKPALTVESLRKVTESLLNAQAAQDGGIEPIKAGKLAEVLFKIEGANVITSLKISAGFLCQTAHDLASIAVSTTNALDWKEVWKNDKTGESRVSLKLVDEVNGAYEVLVKVSLLGKAAAANARLNSIAFETTTMLNSKTQPKLLLGKNTVYVGLGEQTQSIVFWPDLQGEAWKPYAVDSKNMVSEPQHPGYMGVMHAVQPNEDAYVVFKIDAPRDITRITYGGRFYNRAPKSHIDLLHSFDGGKTWEKSYSLTELNPPWDVIHYESVDRVPPGTRSVLFKYLLNSTAAGTNACSIYAVRMEANYQPADPAFRPIEVTFNWSERQRDRSLVERSYTERVEKVPHRFTINVGGEDHPVVNWLRVNLARAVPDVKPGYSDGKDVGSAKFVGNWVTYGNNLAEGKAYTLSHPSITNWGAGDPDGKKLTDGGVGPPYAGGASYSWGALWNPNTNPIITLDLGAAADCASFGMNFHGYPRWDSLKGEVKDKVEVLTSLDGKNYVSQGFLETDLRWKDLPINHLWPDDETITGHTFRLIPEKPVQARFVQFKVTSARIFCCTELEVLDSVRFEPLDLRLALPDEPVIAQEAGDGKQQSGAASSNSALASKPLGEPILEFPTLHCLGAYWIIGGDENKNAKVEVAYRRAGTNKWLMGPPLFRVEKGAHKNEKGQSKLNVPDDAWLFAGSVVLLSPDTEYELRLRLTDPDGGDAEKLLKGRTIGEPVVPEGARQFHVIPGSGGGVGTQADPFRGLAVAQENAKPGDIFLLHAGVYEGTFEVTKSGEPGKPIVWRGAGDGEAILDAQGKAEKRPRRCISASGVHDVWFENLTLRNADFLFVGHDSARIVIRRCHLYQCDYGITCTRNDNDMASGWFISDNVIEGPSTWPRTKGIENARGIQLTGQGHVVCYNRIVGFADAIVTFPSQRCAAIDFHNNDISVMTDDGIEMDYSERNTRCFHNRLTNVFQGISVQPVFGGPVYIFRNVMYNVVAAPFKMHNSPSGALMLHNTSVKKGMAMECFPIVPVRNCVFRNNLFIGTQASYAFESIAPMQDCDFDYDGFGGGPWTLFLKWNGVRYSNLDEVKAKAPVYKHAVIVNPFTAFVSGIRPPDDEKQQFDGSVIDLRLKEGSEAVDAGAPLPGFNDNFTGQAPDLGAYELGSEPPHYGPRPDK